MKTTLISIVVPTFKEAQNIPILVRAIDREMKLMRHPYEIVIVDDDSNDGIDAAVANLRRRFSIKLEIRKNERGLSSAVIKGISLSKGSVVVVMDADLSHPPEKIPELIDPILTGGADFVVGSRFVQGGSASHFNFYRRMNAWFSKMLARPFTKIKDPMAGFFAFPKQLLENCAELNPVGFKIGLEIIVKANPRTVKEIPIAFKERLHGESKLNIREQVKYIFHIIRLLEYKYRKSAEFIRFSLIGGVGMIIDLTSVYLSYGIMALPYRSSRAVGFIAALTTNFILNRKFNFSRKSKKNLAAQYATFFVVCICGFAVNWFISVYLFEHIEFFHDHYLIAAFLGILGGMAVNFSGSKFFVFN